MSARNPRGELCALCGNVAQGFATIDGDRYCHGDDERPTCYMRASNRFYGPGVAVIDGLINSTRARFPELAAAIDALVQS